LVEMVKLLVYRTRNVNANPAVDVGVKESVDVSSYEALEAQFPSAELQAYDDKDPPGWVTITNTNHQQALGWLTSRKQIKVVEGSKAKPDKALVVTFKWGDVAKEETFAKTPSYHALCVKAEELFLDLQIEEFSLKAGKMELSEETWAEVAGGKATITVGVVSHCKAFSSFKADETSSILKTRRPDPEADASHFSEATYQGDAPVDPELAKMTGLQCHADIITSLGRELALRCYKCDPNADKCKKEVISPVIFAAAALAGDVKVEAEYSLHGVLGKGYVDYTIMFQDFAIVVVEGKLHDTLDQHLGQLAAEMQAAREQYARKKLAKRKREEDDDFKKVPSFGILSNGTNYTFYKYIPEAERLVCVDARVNLERKITGAQASENVLPIIRHMVYIIQEQMKALTSFTGKRPKL